MLTVQLNELVTNGQLQEYSIIRLDRYLRNDLKGQAAKYEKKRTSDVEEKCFPFD